jgi:polar amino acid transport system substrate-binding protein
MSRQVRWLSRVALAFALLSLSTPAATAQELPPGITPSGKLQEIIQRRAVTIWMNAGFIPYETIDPATSQFQGLDVDIARMLFEDGLGAQVTFTNSTFQGLVPALIAGQTDFVISAMGATEERAQRVDFSIPYSPGGIVVLTRKENASINSLEDLSGKIMGGETGSTPLRRAEAYNDQLQAMGLQGYAELRAYDSAPTVWEDVRTGRLDAASVGLTNALLLMKERPSDFRIVAKLGGDSYYAMVTPKGEDALLAYVNARIREWKADGTLVAVHRKWFGDFAPDVLDAVPSMPDNVFYSS